MNLQFHFGGFLDLAHIPLGENTDSSDIHSKPDQQCLVLDVMAAFASMFHGMLDGGRMGDVANLNNYSVTPSFDIL
jgi:hypothetical protein